MGANLHEKHVKFNRPHKQMCISNNIYCPPIVWNHPISATVLPHIWWKSICRIRLSVSTVNRTYELSGITHVTHFRKYGKYSTGPSCSPVSPFLWFVVTEPSWMKSLRTEGCHVGLFREFVGTSCCTYGPSNATIIRPLERLRRPIVTLWQTFMVDNHFCPDPVSLLSRECCFPHLHQRQCDAFVLISFSCEPSMYANYHLKPTWQSCKLRPGVII